MSRADTFTRVKDVGIIPAIRSSNPENGVAATMAIEAGGISVVEISLALPGALKVLEAVARACGNEVLVGAGSVLEGASVRDAASSGARFIVTPGLNAEAVETAQDLGLAVFVGALTPTEVHVASRSGADAVKLFPCYSMLGARYLKSLRGQYPQVELIASGGVGVENCSDYFRAGACAIGVGGEIVDADSMAARDHRVFTVRAKRLRAAVRAARASLQYSDNVTDAGS